MLGKFTWNNLLDVIKIIGGIIAATAALFEYSLHNEQERAQTILTAAQFGESDVAQRFRVDLKVLISAFYKDKYPEYWASRDYTDPHNIVAYKKPDDAVAFIKANVISTNDREFKSTYAFFTVVYTYAMTDACNWRLMYEAFSGDAGEFVYYFWPYLPEFAKRQSHEWKGENEPVYLLMFPKYPRNNETCDDNAPASPIARAALLANHAVGR